MKNPRQSPNYSSLSKRFLIGITFLICFQFVQAQNSTGINNSNPNLKAALDIKTTTGYKQGWIMPRLGHADTASIGVTVGKDKGLMFFDTLIGDVRFWDGTKWKGGGNGASSAKSQWYDHPYGIGYKSKTQNYHIYLDTLQGLFSFYNNNLASTVDNQLALSASGGTYVYNMITMSNDFYNNTTTSDKHLRQWGISHLTNSSKLQFQWASGTSGNISYKQHFVIDTSGRVGIGTASPATTLEVEGDMSGGGMLLFSMHHTASASFTTSATASTLIASIPIYIPAGTTQVRAAVSHRGNATGATSSLALSIGSNSSSVSTVTGNVLTIDNSLLINVTSSGWTTLGINMYTPTLGFTAACYGLTVYIVK